MVYDYLGLPKNHLGSYGKAKKLKTRDDGYLNLSSDYLGLSSFAKQSTKDTHRLVKGVINESRKVRNDVDEIKKEVREFKGTVGNGGWIGDYIRRKQLSRKQSKPKKFSNRF